MSINPISTGGGLPPLPPLKSPEDEASNGASFKDYLLKSINEVDGMQKQADRAVVALATGEDINPAEVLTAVQKADLAFRMMMQVRNKIVQAYDEIRSIQV